MCRATIGVRGIGGERVCANGRTIRSRACGSRRRGGGRRPIVGDLFESKADRNNGYTTTV